MKKILICLLAVLVLGLCVLTMTPSVQAEEAEEVVLYHCKCGNKHSTALADGDITWKEGTEKCYGGCDGVILEWTPWGATSNKNAGNYYFVQDYTSARAFTSGDIAGTTINVDMNGYNILVTSAARAINISNSNGTNNSSYYPRPPSINNTQHAYNHHPIFTNSVPFPHQEQDTMNSNGVGSLILK
jgi:hypothetical protein